MTRHIRVAVAVVVLALVAACSRGDGGLERSADAPSTTEATTTTADPPATDPAPSVAPLAWEGCGGGAECAVVAVPLDHDAPDGDTIDLFVRRLPATGERIGALFLNFGGPGAGAAELIDAFPIPAEIRARFDLVGLDPRGVGGSSPLECGIDPVELYAVDPTVDEPSDVDALVAVSERYAADCADRRGEVLPHVGTRDVARDMDLVRAAMGDEQLSYVGYSYGTSIGQAYADLFPSRVRAMVLDGVVDPAPAGADAAAAQAAGFEVALANWASACPARASCPFGGGALDAVDRMLAAAEGGVAAAGQRPLGPGEAAVGLAYPLYQQALWGELDRAVAAALDGDGGPMVDLADGYLTLVDFAPYFAVSCVDATWPATAQELLAAAEAAGRSSPRFGEAIVNDYLRCAVWPAEPDPIGAVTAPDAPPIVVVSTTGDPATPHANGVRVADRLASGVLVVNEGEGHTAVFQGSACIDGIVVPYLVDLTVPAEGTGC